MNEQQAMPPCVIDWIGGPKISHMLQIREHGIAVSLSLCMAHARLCCRLSALPTNVKAEQRG
jgi:hypothetical protein